jgi:Cu/Ag efflux pump CusA
VSIVNLTLWSKSLDDGQLRSLGLELLQQLGKVPNTNNGFVVGGRKEIFHIDVFPGRLAGYGISIQQISNTIGSANVSSHTGDIELNGYKMEVYSGDFFKKVEDIENLVVAVNGGKPVYVRDIADVYYAPEEAHRFSVVSADTNFNIIWNKTPFQFFNFSQNIVSNFNAISAKLLCNSDGYCLFACCFDFVLIGNTAIVINHMMCFFWRIIHICNITHIHRLSVIDCHH